MKTRTTCLWLASVALVVWPSVASARSKDEVVASMKARYPALVKLLAAGKVGETHKGLPDAVKSSYLTEKVEAKGKTITIAQFIKDENADRTEYFQIAAKANNTTPEVIAKNYAQHRQSRLKSGEYWQREDGSWVRKK